jgi:chorismate mutase
LKIKRLKENRNVPLYDAKREEELVNNIIKYNKGPLYNDNIVQIFESILRNVQVLEKDENL